MEAMSPLVRRIYPEAQAVRKPESYHAIYDDWLAEHRNRPLALLELGVHSGHSLALWHAYFPNARITGLDLKPEPDGLPPTRVRYVRGRQEDPAAIAEAARDGPFDLIVDDASHVGTLTRASFEMLFADHLRPGGLYVIEDTAASVALPGWPDHKPFAPGEVKGGVFLSYDAGIMGFLKQLLDLASLGRGQVASLEVRPSIALIRKV
jgi:hypothetical protein